MLVDTAHAIGALDGALAASPVARFWRERAAIVGLANCFTLAGVSLTPAEFFRGAVGLVEPVFFADLDRADQRPVEFGEKHRFDKSDRASKKLGRGQRDSSQCEAIREPDDGGALAPEPRDRRGGKSAVEGADRVRGVDQRGEAVVARERGGGIGHAFSLALATP